MKRNRGYRVPDVNRFLAVLMLRETCSSAELALAEKKIPHIIDCKDTLFFLVNPPTLVPGKGSSDSCYYILELSFLELHIKKIIPYILFFFFWSDLFTSR